jgi:hypothetical protein
MLLLCKFGLSGFSTGVCYGVSKDVDTPVSTGGGQERYYLPIVHAKRMETNLRLSLSVSTYNAGLLCDCDLCESLKKDLEKLFPMPARKYVDQFFTNLNERKNGFREHFIRARLKEALTVEGETQPQLKTRLQMDANAVDRSTPPPPLPSPFQNPLTSHHLKNWAELF